MVERFAGIDRAAAARTALLAERLTFDLTEELGYRYPDFSDRADPAIRQLAAICDHAFAEQYSASDTVLRGKARARLDEIPQDTSLLDELLSGLKARATAS